jgi:hypothetical protein
MYRLAWPPLFEAPASNLSLNFDINRPLVELSVLMGAVAYYILAL